ncbi:unnamed protein product, partial [Medioppia subpectinata]
PATGFTFISLYNIIIGTMAITIQIGFTYRYSYLYEIETQFKTFMYYYGLEMISFLTPVTLFFNGITSLNQILYNNYCQVFEAKGLANTSCASDKPNDRNICCLPKCESNYTEYEVFYAKTVHTLRIDSFNTDCYQHLNPFTYMTGYYIRFILYGLLYMCINCLSAYLNVFLAKEWSEIISMNSKTSTKTGLVSLIADNLTKKFSKSVIIPNKLSFMVNKEECFGLLGTNGSGKTTTFRLLTGDLDRDSGNAYLGSDADLLNNKKTFYSRIGYCPQNDALLDRLTGMQTLLFFGRLRGLERNALKTFIAHITDKFELNRIINSRLSTYSGGNRRKLSLAVALIGTPRLLLLDEPTNGVDPDSRLKIWGLLRDLMSTSKVSILLTSHNMSECEALCSRLAIVSKGVIKSVGYVSQLKTCFAKGYDIILKVRNDSNEEIIDKLKAKMSSTFGNKCLLKYDNYGVIYYNLIRRDIKLSQIFQSLQTLKHEFEFEDYFVANASLEQAFLSIVASNERSPQVGYSQIY